MSVQVFSLPKSGNRPQEYEDAWDYDAKAQRFAIADGASDSSFESRLWARALVRLFCREPPTPEMESTLKWLPSPIRLWRDGIDWENLKWYAEEKARRGAFSTLLGVVFTNSATDLVKGQEGLGHWQAYAMGDSCLFQIRDDKMIVHFPIEKAIDFGSTPSLLSTLLEYDRLSLQELKDASGECRLGDLFVLATDALAYWFLKQVEDGQQPWKQLVNLTPEEFQHLVAQLRQDRALRNDDVTLLLVRMPDRENEEMPYLSDDLQTARP